MAHFRDVTDFYKRINFSAAKECYQADLETTELECNGRKKHYEHVFACGNILRQVIFVKTWRSVWIISLLL
jgi:hypothetical protein